MADKSPRQSSSKKSGKSLKQKRADKKAASANKDNRVVIPPRQVARRSNSSAETLLPTPSAHRRPRQHPKTASERESASCYMIGRTRPDRRSMTGRPQGLGGPGVRPRRSRSAGGMPTPLRWPIGI